MDILQSDELRKCTPCGRWLRLKNIRFRGGFKPANYHVVNSNGELRVRCKKCYHLINHGVKKIKIGASYNLITQSVSAGVELNFKN